MVKKLIILIVFILIPIVLADFIQLEPPEKTKDKKLCISGTTNNKNTIKVNIDNIFQSFILKDERIVTELKIDDGPFYICINLHSGKNNVKITSKPDWANVPTAEKEFIIELDELAPKVNINLLDYINNRNPKFTISIDESGILIITINGKENRISVNAGNPEIELSLNEGENNVKIEVEDAIGNKAIIIEKKIMVDTLKPKVIINSVDDKTYSENMKVNFRFVKINGKTEPNIELKVINLFDNITYYYKEQKFLKSNDEIKSKSEKIIKTDEQGNFEDYIDLLPGKNAIVFLATDKSGNQNTIPQNINNLDTLILNYEAGENWNFVVDYLNKVKAADLIRNEIPVRIEIIFSPKNIDPKKIRDVKFSVTYDTRDRRKPREEITKPVEDINQFTRISGRASQPYYNEKKKAYIVYQDLAINPFPGKIKDVPDKILAIFRGDITFFVGDIEKTSSITEHIPIDLLFYIEAQDAKFLIPFNVETMSKAVDGSLKTLEDVFKYSLWATGIDAGLCGLLKLLPWEPKKLEYSICDRVWCYDTAPTDLQIEEKPAISPYGQIYSPGFPNYHETSCLPNTFVGYSKEFLFFKKPVFSPVRVYDDIWSSSKCVCLTGMLKHLRNVYATLSALQSCLDESKLGRTDLGMCDIRLAQASCGLVFWAIKKATLPELEKPYHIRMVGEKFPITSEIDLKELYKGLNKEMLKKAGFYVAEEALHGICINILSQNWEHMEDIAVRTGLERMPSFGRAVTNSWLIEEKEEELKIMYHITPVIAGIHDIRYDLKFKCDPNQANADLCQGEGSDRAALDLGAQMYSRGTTISGVGMPSGYGSYGPARIQIEDDQLRYWFNAVELTITGYITALERPFTQVIESKISQTGVGRLKELCNVEDYKIYPICKIISERESFEKNKCSPPNIICPEGTICTIPIPSSDYPDRCCHTDVYCR